MTLLELVLRSTWQSGSPQIDTALLVWPLASSVSRRPQPFPQEGFGDLEISPLCWREVCLLVMDVSWLMYYDDNDCMFLPSFFPGLQLAVFISLGNCLSEICGFSLDLESWGHRQREGLPRPGVLWGLKKDCPTEVADPVGCKQEIAFFSLRSEPFS